MHIFWVGLRKAYANQIIKEWFRNNILLEKPSKANYKYNFKISFHIIVVNMCLKKIQQLIKVTYLTILFVLCVGLNCVLRGCILAKEVWTILSRRMVDQIFFSLPLYMWMNSNLNIGKTKGVNWSLYLLM